MPLPWTVGQTMGQTDLNAMNEGTLGYAQLTANSGTPGATPAVFAGFGVTVNQVAGRRLRVSASCNLLANTGTYPTVGHLYIYSGGGPSQIQTVAATMAVANYWWNANISIVLPNVAAGTVVYNIYGSVDSGVIGVIASATQPAYILVEDIGV